MLNRLSLGFGKVFIYIFEKKVLPKYKIYIKV